MDQRRPSSWCSFIPTGFLSSIANDQSLSSGIRESALRTIDEGDALLNKAESLGKPVLQHPNSPGRPILLIYEAGHESVLPGEPYTLKELQEGRKSSYSTILYNIIGGVAEFFEAEFGHTLFKDQRCTIAVTMNYGENYMNAHWTGRRIILGSGYEGLLEGFRYAKDVIVHELTHGIIMRTSGLQDCGETGALNEHLADVFGVLYKHYLEGKEYDSVSDVEAENLTWTIGEDLWSFDAFRPANLHPKPSTDRSSSSFSQAKYDKWKFRSLGLPIYVRSFADPTSTNPPQPIDYRDFERVNYDKGGVHLNSGIPNFAFYTAAVAAGGPSWQGVGKVWFCAMTNRNLGKDCPFARFAAFTIAYAMRDLVEPITRGWETVKVVPAEVDGIQYLL